MGTRRNQGQKPVAILLSFISKLPLLSRSFLLLFLNRFCPEAAGDYHSSKPCPSQRRTTLPAASSSWSLQPHLPNPTQWGHSSKETSDPILRTSLRQRFSSPSWRAVRRSRRGWPAGTVLAAAACRRAEESAVMEKQQNSTGFGGGEDRSDKFPLPPQLSLLNQ